MSWYRIGGLNDQYVHEVCKSGTMWLIFFELVSGCNFISISIWFQCQQPEFNVKIPFSFRELYQSIRLQLRKEKLNRVFHFFAPRNEISVGIPLTDMSLNPFSCYFRDRPGRPFKFQLISWVWASIALRVISYVVSCFSRHVYSALGLFYCDKRIRSFLLYRWH